GTAVAHPVYQLAESCSGACGQGNSGVPLSGNSALAASAVSWPTGASACPVLVHRHHATFLMRSTGSSPSQIDSGGPPWTAQTGHSISGISLSVAETESAALHSSPEPSSWRDMPWPPPQYEPSGKVANTIAGHPRPKRARVW